MEINLTQLELDAFTEMGVTSIENYLKAIAVSHISQKIDSQLIAKTLEEKQALLEE
jgi:hypothetical protein